MVQDRDEVQRRIVVDVEIVRGRETAHAAHVFDHLAAGFDEAVEDLDRVAAELRQKIVEAVYEPGGIARDQDVRGRRVANGVVDGRAVAVGALAAVAEPGETFDGGLVALQFQLAHQGLDGVRRCFRGWSLGSRGGCLLRHSNSKGGAKEEGERAYWFKGHEYSSASDD